MVRRRYRPIDRSDLRALERDGVVNRLVHPTVPPQPPSDFEARSAVTGEGKWEAASTNGVIAGHSRSTMRVYENEHPAGERRPVLAPLPRRASRRGYFNLMVVKWLLPSLSFS
jgi:hypothetical protein